MERRTIEENKEKKRTTRCWWGCGRRCWARTAPMRGEPGGAGGTGGDRRRRAGGYHPPEPREAGPHSFIGEGKVEEVKRMVEKQRRHHDHLRQRPVTLPDTGADGAVRCAGTGPQWVDPGHLRPAGQNKKRAVYRWSWHSTSTCCRGWWACGPIWSGRRAPAARDLSAPRAPARRSWRRTGGTSTERSTS